MERCNGFFLVSALVLVVLATGAFTATAHVIEQSVHNVTAQEKKLLKAPVNNKYVPPEQTPSAYDKFLDACAKRMTDPCADQIVNGVFKNGVINKDCCVKLVYMGNDCHNELVKKLVEFSKDPDHKGDQTEILGNSDKVWKKCSKVAKTVPKPPNYSKNVPKLPPRDQLPGYQKFLEGCASKMTDNCADQIVGKIFENKNVSDECCVKLVNMGDDCHDEMLKRLLKLPQHKDKASKIQSKSDKVWKKCKKVAKRKPKKVAKRKPLPSPSPTPSKSKN